MLIRKLGASTFSLYNKAKGRRGFGMSNFLSEVHPELIGEWSEKNYPLMPNQVMVFVDKMNFSL